MTRVESANVSPKRESLWLIATMVVMGVILLSLLLASPLLIRTFLYQPVNTPSGSMKPTFQVGDYLFVSKSAYGYSWVTWPFGLSQPSSGRIWGSMPERGDVVVFRTKDGKTDYVKRVVGLPGDRVQMRSGVLYINDAAVQRQRLADVAGLSACGDDDGSVKQWRETLPNGRSYETLDCVDNGFYDTTNLYTVPSGHLFVLGDNRDNSIDSRVLSSVGYVPIENVVGRADMIFFSIAGGTKAEPAGIRWDRIGRVVR